MRRSNYLSQGNKALIYRLLGYFIPFLSLPIFVHNLSPSDYGRLGVVLTLCGVLQAICEGGANIGGAKRLALASSSGQSSLILAGIRRHKYILLSVSSLLGATYCFALAHDFKSLVLYAACFTWIVLPDALTPTWIYYSKGAVGELTEYLFFSRLVSLAPALLLVWLIPTAYVAAFATGLPFLVYYVVVHRNARLLQPTDIVVNMQANEKRLASAQPLVHLGSFAAQVFPAVVMQSLAWSNVRQLGIFYLALTLWVALRQLCIIPNQAAFHLSVATDVREIKFWKVLAKAAFSGALVAWAGALFVWMSEAWLFKYVFGGNYGALGELLFPMFASVGLYAIGHGLAMNCLAAHGRDVNFALCHLISIGSYLFSYIVLGNYREAQRLVSAVVIGDLVLLLTSCIFSFWSFRPDFLRGK